MAITFHSTTLHQTFACVAFGKTLYFKYRSGWTDAAGMVVTHIRRTQPSGSDHQTTILLSSQGAWLPQSIPITITATEIIISFYITVDTTQWLDIDDVYVG